MTDFSEYIVQSDLSRKQKAENWQIAIGLQDVDQIKISRYLIDTARSHIEGKLAFDEVEKRITDYYRTEEGRKLAAERTDEADLVAAHIAEILSEDAFSLIPAEYARIHRRLFCGVFDHAGEFRKVNLSKREWVLDGDSVTYIPYDGIKETLDYDFKEERSFNYEGVSAGDAVNHICKFISGIWEIHPFREGNTRATAVFAILYLRRFGFKINNELFKEYSWYFRNALVRANYSNYEKKISPTTRYLEKFIENLIFDGKNELKSRFCHIYWNGAREIQSANPKCKNCTLDETAILEILSKSPKATQQELAKEIGKSLRTVKNIMTALRKRGLLIRSGGRRNGEWVIMYN